MSTGAGRSGASGAARGLFFHDADGNGAYTPGGRDGVSKGAAPAALFDVAAGALGTAANVFYLDRNGDLVHNPGEDLLVAGRNGAADVPVRFYQPGVDGFLHSGRWPAAVGPGQAPPADAVGTPGQVHPHDADGFFLAGEWPEHPAPVGCSSCKFRSWKLRPPSEAAAA